MIGGLGALIMRLARVVRLFIGHQGIGDRPLLLFGILLVFIGVSW